MAKQTRRTGTSPARRTIKTSLVIDAHLHARLSALASLRGCTINALLVEAAKEVAKCIAIMDKRKGVQGDLSDLENSIDADAA